MVFAAQNKKNNVSLRVWDDSLAALFKKYVFLESRFLMNSNVTFCYLCIYVCEKVVVTNYSTQGNRGSKD